MFGHGPFASTPFAAILLFNTQAPAPPVPPVPQVMPTGGAFLDKRKPDKRDTRRRDVEALAVWLVQET